MLHIIFFFRKWLHQGNIQKKSPNPEDGSVDAQSNYITRPDNKNNIVMDNTLQRDQHNYFRTWELQRHQMPRPNMDPAMESHTIPDNQYDHRYADHIYESPTFARKEVSDEGAQYYELDPEAEPFQPTVSYRDANANSTNGTCSLPKQRCSYPGMSENNARVITGGNLTS